jgi:hypothetical protein
LRSTLRTIRIAAVAVPGLLLVAGGVAHADTGTATSNASFGVLGPVGLVAVALGIVGMTLGVLRQRRKARAAAVAEPAAPENVVTAMAVTVLADVDNTPTRPILTPRPRP